MAILLPDHDLLLQGSTRRPLSVEDFVQLLKSAATSFNAKEVPADGVDEIEADKDEVVAPVDGIQSDSSDIGVVQICGIRENNVLWERSKSAFLNNWWKYCSVCKKRREGSTYNSHTLGTGSVGQNFRTVCSG